MKYLQYVSRSPKLALQLLTVLVLACVVGGTGLLGLRMARTGITDLSSAHMAALVNLLEAERDIAQVDYYGLAAIHDTDPRRRAKEEFPKIRSLTAAAQQNFAQYEAIRAPNTNQGALQARIKRLLQGALLLSAQAGHIDKLRIGDAAGLALFKSAEASLVDPLTRDLATLARIEETDMNNEGSLVGATTQATTMVLSGVIVLALLVAGTFQIGIGAREHRRQAMLKHSADLVVFLDAQGVIRYVSPTFERILGFQPSSLVGRDVLEFIHAADRDVVRAALIRRIQNESAPVELEFRTRHANGSYRWLASTAHNQLRDSLIRGIVVTSRDVTERKETEAALAFQASHDALTGMPNRLLLLERLQQALVESAAQKQTLALVLLDLDRFKEVNDTLGHHVGDLLLQQVSQRLSDAVRAGDLVARLGGDEYAILLPGTAQSSAERLAGRLCEALHVPFVVADETLEIGVSLGIALYPDHGQEPLLLLQHADVAMYEAKRQHQHLAVYDAEQDRHSLEQLGLVRDLRHALEQGHLLLYYQPKVELSTHRLRGMEALVRWPHPTLGFIPPDQFIPLAEQTGLIWLLTDWVLETALSQHTQWSKAGRIIPVAVNLSTRILQDLQLPERVARLLAHHDVPPDCLTLEITETSLMVDPERARAVLTKLHALGVHLSIDDFGTGYSSLGYLKELPVHELKIDKSFVLGIGATAETKDAAIVRSVVAMAHALGLEVVAEGVEDAGAQVALEGLACDVIQGFYISRPAPPDDLAHWLCDAVIKVMPLPLLTVPARSLDDSQAAG